MLDIIGITEFGQSKNNAGIFLYRDGSIGIGYKVPGIKFKTMTSEEMEFRYEKLRNIINQLEELYKGEGRLYQMISQPTYDISKQRKKALKTNFIRKHYSKDSGVLFEKILNKNINDSYDLYEDSNVMFRENYIFVRIYLNFSKYKVSRVDFLKKIFALKDFSENDDMKEFNKIMEQRIETHTAKFRALKALPLNLLEMINVVRKYFGFSNIKKLPNLNVNDDLLKHLFPRKVVIENDYIKTSETIDISQELKEKHQYDEEKWEEKILEQREKDNLTLSDPNSVDNKSLDDDLKILFIDLMGQDPISINEYPTEEKFRILKYYIKDIVKLEEFKTYIPKLSYLNKDILETYYKEKFFNYNTSLEKSDTYIKIYTMHELPSKLNIFHGESLNSMYGDFTITLNFRKLNTTEAQTKMRRQIIMENVKLGMPVMKWFIPIEAVEEKVQILRNVIRTLDRADYSRVERSLFLTLRHNTDTDPRENNIVGSYDNITDMKWVGEKQMLGFFAFTNTMPTGYCKSGLRHSRRNLLINTSNIAQLSPMLNEEEGAKHPIVTSIGYNSLININLNEAKAGHLAIQGGTGGGKSFFANKLLLQYFMNGDKGITTEKGDSFTRSTIFFGGKVYKPDMSGSIKINPFVMPDTAWEDDEFKKSIYAQMVAAMSQMCDNYEQNIQNIYYKLIKNAFENNGGPNTKYVINNAITPSILLDLMKTKWGDKFQEEQNSFEKYTAKGLYGALFDGNSGLDMTYPSINIDYSKLVDPAIKDFVFKSLLQNIFNEMSKSSGQTFFNINDEFWDAIATSGASGDNVVNTAIGQVEAFFRVARKLGGKIGVVSQAISDIADSPLAKAVLNNIYHSVFTNTASAGELKVIEQLFKLQEHQLDRISNLSQEKGKYSEYYILAPYGEKQGGANVERRLTTKFKYYPTPFETALFTTHPMEKRVFKLIYEELGAHGDPSTVSQEHAMKAVRLFADVLPKGVEVPYFQEKLIGNANDPLYTFKQIVEEKYGSFKNAIKGLDWRSFIEMVEK